MGIAALNTSSNGFDERSIRGVRVNKIVDPGPDGFWKKKFLHRGKHRQISWPWPGWQHRVLTGIATFPVRIDAPTIRKAVVFCAFMISFEKAPG
jgi:hypothetical protein